MLCADQTKFCLYQTPDLPLAVWMALFILGGVLTSLLTHLFNRYRYAGYGKKRPAVDYFPEDDDKWSMRNGKSDRVQDSNSKDKYSSSSYEVPQKPESIERAGSTYSYKYRDAKGESSNGLPKKDSNSRKNSIDSDIDSNLDRDKDDEDWI